MSNASSWLSRDQVLPDAALISTLSLLRKARTMLSKIDSTINLVLCGLRHPSNRFNQINLRMSVHSRIGQGEKGDQRLSPPAKT